MAPCNSTNDLPFPMPSRFGCSYNEAHSHGLVWDQAKENESSSFVAFSIVPVVLFTEPNPLDGTSFLAFTNHQAILQP